MAVSVVMPARNAAATLSRALESLLAQSRADWEAIVVDDGSTDETGDIAHEWSRRDPRIRVLQLEGGGVSAARNAAIAVAEHPLLLFLDADDEMRPNGLELLCGALEREPAFVGAYGPWARVAPDTRLINVYPAAVPGGDLFPVFARYCVFAIHACVVRRAAVRHVGGFDTSLTTCEDWDLWQRIARVGGRFLHVPAQVALYHLSPGSASSNALRLLTDGLLVAERGHGIDSRLDGIEQRHPLGVPADGLAVTKLYIGCWSAGLAVAEGADPLELLEALPSEPVADLDPQGAGLTMYDSAIRLQPLAPSDIAREWDTFGPRARGFLEALERRVAAHGLSEQAIRTIERRLVLDSPELRPITIGATHATTLELTAPLADLACAGVDRAVVDLAVEGARVGSVELPVVDGVVPAEVIGDVDVRVAWQLLGPFFARNLYTDPAADFEELGWTSFLREIWGKESWSADDFYDARKRDDPAAAEQRVDAGGVRLEVTEPLPTLVTDASHLSVTLLVGGRALGTIRVETANGRIEPQRLRAALTTAGGLELCRLAVVQALVGRPLDGGTLRSRLREAAGQKRPKRDGRTVVGRHPSAPIGSSASRTAWLPSSVADEMRELAVLNRQPFREGNPAAAVVYAPELVDGETAAQDQAVPEPVDADAAPAYGRRHFEELLATSTDPWRYESAYERRKYALTLELIGQGADRILEVGCAEGHFTVELAPLAAELVAADLSEIALARARERCSELDNVSFVQLDIGRDPLPGAFDVIVCSELLYYVGAKALPAVAKKLAAGLSPGGALVLAHAHLQVDEPSEPGFDWGLPYGARYIGDVLGRRRDLTLVRELRTPYYRVQRFERTAATGLRGRLLRRPAPIVEDVAYEEPEGEMAASFHWARPPSRTVHVDRNADTRQLPILMYHRIADEGPDATARWRVGIELFERQLAYLADAGFRTVTFDEWRTATEQRRPLPGRAVVLTFDDAYVDFEENAWPILERYGFGALVAVVTDLAGGVASWDARFGEPAPLLDWDSLRALSRKGVELASHAVTHTPLTALSVPDMARECARSRRAIEQETGQRVTTIVYPHGACDPVVEHVSGAVGYVYGLATESGLASSDHRLLALPRQEVTGDMSFGEFVRALTPPREL